MDLQRIITKLVEERKELERIIEGLERKQGSLLAASGRGRKFMNTAERREVSHRMKRYWAKRREERAAAPGIQAGVPEMGSEGEQLETQDNAFNA